MKIHSCCRHTIIVSEKVLRDSKYRFPNLFIYCNFCRQKRTNISLKQLASISIIYICQCFSGYDTQIALVIFTVRATCLQTRNAFSVRICLKIDLDILPTKVGKTNAIYSVNIPNLLLDGYIFERIRIHFADTITHKPIGNQN